MFSSKFLIAALFGLIVVAVTAETSENLQKVKNSSNGSKNEPGGIVDKVMDQIENTPLVPFAVAYDFMKNVYNYLRCIRDDYMFSSKMGCHKIYYDEEHGVNWKQARGVCQDDGADLAVIDSQEKAEYFANIIVDVCACASNAWIGVYAKNNSWVTPDEKIFSATNSDPWFSLKKYGKTFRNGRPDNNTCLTLTHGITPEGLVPFDCDFGWMKRFICERK